MVGGGSVRYLKVAGDKSCRSGTAVKGLTAQPADASANPVALFLLSTRVEGNALPASLTEQANPQHLLRLLMPMPLGARDCRLTDVSLRSHRRPSPVAGRSGAITDIPNTSGVESETNIKGGIL